MAGLRQQLQNALRIIERSWHQVWRFIASITKHDALVASANIFVGCIINALGNISGLIVQQYFDFGSVPMETILFIADGLDGLAGNINNHLCGHRLRTAHFAADHHAVGCGKCFTAQTHPGGVHLIG